MADTLPLTEAQVLPEQPQAQDPDVSSKFAHLARKEKAFREQQRKFQTERQSWDQQREQLKAQIEAEIFGRYTKDPIGFAKERGITEDQLGSLLLNQQNPEVTQIYQLQQQNKDLLERIEKINQRFEETETNSYNQALNQIGYEAKQLVSAEAEKYELISAAGDQGIDAVKELCKAYWEEDKVLLSVQEAAEMVEQELLEQSLKLASAKKVAAKLQPAPLEPEKTPQQASKTRTLNSQAIQAVSGPVKDRVQRAKLVAQGINPDTGLPFGKN